MDFCAFDVVAVPCLWNLCAGIASGMAAHGLIQAIDHRLPNPSRTTPPPAAPVDPPAPEPSRGANP